MAGENEEVQRALGRPPLQGRGIRILSMDGGGMKVWSLHLSKLLQQVHMQDTVLLASHAAYTAGFSYFRLITG